MSSQYVTRLLTLSICSLVFTFSSTVEAKVFYVKQGVVGGNGSSWSNAYNNLDDALSAAASNPGYDEIWVAKGTYLPGTLYAPMGIVGGLYGGSDTQLKTFTLHSDLAIYGGFSGNEKSKSKRNRDANPTVLSGDLHGDDSNTPTDTNTNKSDNVWHVLTAGDDVNKVGVTNVALDSLIVRGGYAAGPDSGALGDNAVLESIAYTHAAGGGLIARFESTITLNNMLFEYNAANGANATIVFNGFALPVAKASGGGAVAVSDESHVTITQSDFQYNTSFFRGGGGGALKAMLESSYDISQSRFSNNIANRNGGAIHGIDAELIDLKTSHVINNKVVGLFIFDESGGGIGAINTNLKVSASVFEGNSSNPTAGGGAIFFHVPFDDGEPYSLVVNTSIFKNNKAASFGGGAINAFATLPHPGSSVQISSSVFDGNEAGLGGGVYIDSFKTDISYSIFHDNRAWVSGGGLFTSNFADVILGSDDPLARERTNVSNVIFKYNKTISLPSGIIIAPRPLLNVLAVAFSGQSLDTLESGGAGMVVTLGGKATITDSTFIYNQAIGYGGALLVGASDGGLLGMDQATASITQSICYGNSATIAGANTHVLDTGGAGIGVNGVELIGSCP